MYGILYHQKSLSKNEAVGAACACVCVLMGWVRVLGSEMVGLLYIANWPIR